VITDNVAELFLKPKKKINSETFSEHLLLFFVILILTKAKNCSTDVTQFDFSLNEAETEECHFLKCKIKKHIYIFSLLRSSSSPKSHQTSPKSPSPVIPNSHSLSFRLTLPPSTSTLLSTRSLTRHLPHRIPKPEENSSSRVASKQFLMQQFRSQSELLSSLREL
jgi:hypothetical protein